MFLQKQCRWSRNTDTNNYYPFGLNHIGGNGLNSSGFGSWPSYKYNGKEFQETEPYDYGVRFYMPDLGRWGVMDAMSEKYGRHSLYNYTITNPAMFIDLYADAITRLIDKFVK